MYGPIIYDKAPVVMRQLELMVGETAFREGMREYLKALSVRQRDVARPGPHPRRAHAARSGGVEPRLGGGAGPARVRHGGAARRVGPRVGPDADAAGSAGRGLVWPQRLRVTLGYGRVREGPHRRHRDAGARRSRRPSASTRRCTSCRTAPGSATATSCSTTRSRAVPGRSHRGRARSADARQRLGDAVGQHARAPRARPTRCSTRPCARCRRETDEQNAQRILSYAVRAYWRYLTPRAARRARARASRPCCAPGLARAPDAEPEGGVVQRVSATSVASADGTGVARAGVAARGTGARPDAGRAGRDRDGVRAGRARGAAAGRRSSPRSSSGPQNPDRKARLAFVMPALSADPGERERAFERFARPREPPPRGVGAGIAAVPQPPAAIRARGQVRAAGARDAAGDPADRRHLLPDAVDRVVRLWGHQSPEVAATVRAFLARNRTYPTRLRWTVLSAADDLFRSAAMQTLPKRVMRGAAGAAIMPPC